jgi:hypothetical protein
MAHGSKGFSYSDINSIETSLIPISNANKKYNGKQQKNTREQRLERSRIETSLWFFAS